MSEMNLKEISIDEAKALPEGHELWAGQTRGTAVKGVATRGRTIFAKGWWTLDGSTVRMMKLFIPTPDAVPLDFDEATVRWANGIENEWFDGADGWRPTMCQPRKQDQYRIPAIPSPKQRYLVETLDAIPATEVKLSVGTWETVATVIEREEAE